MTKINILAGVTRKDLTKLCDLWEQDYHNNNSTKSWQGYVQMKHELGELDTIPRDLKMHLNALAMLEENKKEPAS